MEKVPPLLSFFEICSEILEGDFGPAVQTAGIVLFVIVFNFFIRTLLYKLSERFLKQQNIWALSFISALHHPLTYYVWLVAAVCSLDILSSSLLNFHIDGLHVILSVSAVLAFGWFLMRWNNQVVKNMMEMSQNHQIALTPGKLDLISKVATMAIIFITVFLLMDVTGRNMQTLIAFGGIGGLALAFASQQVISNFFGGLMVYITQPFTIGEFVSLPEKKIEGNIEEIGWYLTRIRNLEKRPIYVPNSIFTQTIVITPSRMSHERFHHTIGLRYEDIGVVRQVVDDIKLMLLQQGYIDRQQKVEVFFTGFGSSSLDINVSAYISALSGADFPTIRQDILLKIADIVAKQGAEIATPTNIVEIQGGVILKDPDLTTINPAAT
ncbi:mechanosensitive ion channel family protein [Candidatus Protochlamydia phocaeensis]|uniref:mechanosensitive ion channel family protein n=1 Tax=Candidatus Protochlamydia phocaeensis TaxID=1414722 RepID=UPI000837B200|nr:mechanosensitive ion channel family protein [Candidatus Protochlamydia phocaeensis]